MPIDDVLMSDTPIDERQIPVVTRQAAPRATQQNNPINNILLLGQDDNENSQIQPNNSSNLHLHNQASEDDFNQQLVNDLNFGSANSSQYNNRLSINPLTDQEQITPDVNAVQQNIVLQGNSQS